MLKEPPLTYKNLKKKSELKVDMELIAKCSKILWWDLYFIFFKWGLDRKWNKRIYKNMLREHLL